MELNKNRKYYKITEEHKTSIYLKLLDAEIKIFKTASR